MRFRTPIPLALGCLALAAGTAEAASLQKNLARRSLPVVQTEPTGLPAVQTERALLPAVQRERGALPAVQRKAARRASKGAATKDLAPAVPSAPSPIGQPASDRPFRAPGPAPRAEGASPDAGGCRDPEAVGLRLSGASRNADGTWQFSLTGTVRNAGDAAFRSRPDQQSAGVWQGSDRRAVAHFSNLNPGQRTNTTPLRVARWYTGQEFHEGFTLRIDYDPDIFIDGNERNDDCRLGNNELRLTAGAIDRILLERER